MSKAQVRKLRDLAASPLNPRKITSEALIGLEESIRKFGDLSVIVWNKTSGHLVAGHQRLKVMRKIGVRDWVITPDGKSGYIANPKTGERFPIRIVEWDPITERAANLAANNPEISGEYDTAVALEQLEQLAVDFPEFASLRLDVLEADLRLLSNEEKDDAAKASGSGSLAEKFLIPPFTVLDARQGWWQDRKRAWIALGITSEEGRADSLTFRDGADPLGAKMGAVGATSVFDPVLCELSYLWFCPPGGTVLDPFAGGSVRGIVASKLGRSYVGIELRKPQVLANRKQAAKLTKKTPSPKWIVGDSVRSDEIAPGAYDFVFTCPPYGDLEVYSDNPSDLSTKGHSEFLDSYRIVIRKAIGMLREDRFAVVVVGDFRDKKGFMRDFVSATIAAFIQAGAALYNEAILVTPVGSLSQRAGRQFAATRKMGKAHQNVLVFCKGDPRKAVAACGDVAIVDMAEQFGEVVDASAAAD